LAKLEPEEGELRVTRNVDIALPEGKVEGFCEESWRPVLDEFVRNFHERGEAGASLTVRHEGQTRIDVWGGIADPATGAPWRENSVSVVFSATKGATALCAHILASRGELDLDQKVSHYWPEFAQKGKGDTTVAMFLDHSAGVPGFIDPIPQGAFLDWAYMARRLAEEEPWWEPGSRNGYHLLNIGWTVGEIVRRISGLSLGEFFQREVARPLGLDFWIGLPDAAHLQFVKVLPYIPGDIWQHVGDFAQLCIDRPDSRPARAIANTGGFVALDAESGAYAVNDFANLKAEVGGAGGVTNARGLALMYDQLAAGGGKLVSADQVWRMSQVAMVSHADPILQIPTRFSLGFMKALDNRRKHGAYESLLISDRAFGHVGAGGSLGMADPDCGLAFGYTMNRMGPGSMLNPRGQALVDATYRCLGYRSNASGFWAR